MDYTFTFKDVSSVKLQRLIEFLNDHHYGFSPQPVLNKTDCYTPLELLATMLNEEHKAYQDNIENYMVSSEHDYNIETLNNVIKLIKERQANGV